MDKKEADKIVTEYLEKIFGFALSKTMNTDKAEELASIITFDVYLSLLKIDNVYNINGYIYKIAQNVYARFVNDEIRNRHISINESELQSENDFQDNFEKDETYIRLRTEISYLGRIQREIVVMHYFQKLKQYEIAERLNLPLGTVKWHLHDARNQIKEGFNKMSNKGNLGMKPVKFHMGLAGKPGVKGEDTEYYLSKLISQNVAYAAYFEAKTITEIAEELGVPAAYVENEVAYLEDNGFLDKIGGGKYLTNIFINDFSNEFWEQRHKFFTKCAKLVCEKYVPLVFDAMTDFQSKGIYSPEDDFNFLMWSMIAYSTKKLYIAHEYGDLSKYYVKHKDGGEYMANAVVYKGHIQNELSFNKDLYKCDEFDMDYRFRKEYPVDSWQIKTCYDDRSSNWRDNTEINYRYLYEYMTGKITKEPAHADKFKILFDKGYIVTKGDSEYVNLIVTTVSRNDFLNLLPAIPDELKALSEEFNAESFKIHKTQYPQRMHELCRMFFTNCFGNFDTKMRVLEQLSVNRILMPLTETQKLTVNTIMFCDVLPG